MSSAPYPHRCGACGAEWFTTHVCPTMPTPTTAVEGGCLNITGMLASQKPEMILVPKKTWEDAMALEKWIADLQANGNRIYVQARNGYLHEVTFKRPWMQQYEGVE